MRAPEPDHTHETSRTRRQRDAKPRPGQVGINDGRPDHHVVFASRRDALMPRAPLVWRERSDYSPRPAESYHRLRLQPCRCLRTHTHTKVDDKTMGNHVCSVRICASNFHDFHGTNTTHFTTRMSVHGHKSIVACVQLCVHIQWTSQYPRERPELQDPRRPRAFDHLMARATAPA